MIEENMETNSSNAFDFIKNPEKLVILLKANETLNISKGQHNKIIFIYSAPKVGSTSIVSSLRIFGLEKFVIIHIHDEDMLRVLGHIDGITINELILFNKYLGKEVYVIDIYRSPIERKISVFFEKIGSYHFNNTDQNINNYNVNKVINRFNNIFSHIGNGDHFMDRYNITIPDKFDFKNNFLLVEENGIKYIKLRLKDSNKWGQILTNILHINIGIIKDYETTKKPIKNIYNVFKNNYKIPKNFLDELMNCKYLNYYYSEEEKQQYYNDWNRKSSESVTGYTIEQYNIYNEITIENSHIDFIQFNHYIDEGCLCKACNLKRRDIAAKIMRGIQITERIIHTEAKSELIQKRAVQVEKINIALQSFPKKTKQSAFKQELTTIVKGKRL